MSRRAGSRLTDHPFAAQRDKTYTVITLLLDAQSVVRRDEGDFGVVLPAGPNAVTRIAELVQLSQRARTYSSVEEAIGGSNEEGHVGLASGHLAADGEHGYERPRS